MAPAIDMGTLTSMMGILDDINLRLHTTLIIAAYALIFLAAVIAVIGTVPYIALQLKAISDSVTLMVSHYDVFETAQSTFHVDISLIVAILLSIFAILFGISVLMVGKKAASAIEFFEIMNEVMMKMVGLVMLVAPYAVFALLAGAAIGGARVRGCGVDSSVLLFEPGALRSGQAEPELLGRLSPAVEHDRAHQGGDHALARPPRRRHEHRDPDEDGDDRPRRRAGHHGAAAGSAGASGSSRAASPSMTGRHRSRPASPPSTSPRCCAPSAPRRRPRRRASSPPSTGAPLA